MYVLYLLQEINYLMFWINAPKIIEDSSLPSHSHPREDDAGGLIYQPYDCKFVCFSTTGTFLDPEINSG